MTNAPERSNSARLFALLWACAMVVDTHALVKKAGSLTAVIEYLVIAAAIWLILKPTSLQRLMILAFVTACQAFEQMPIVPNHWMATSTINLTVVAAGLWVMLRERGERDPLASAYTYFAPSIRIQLALVYFFAALHKTNWDYFDPSISCASNMAGNHAAMFFLPRDIASGLPAILGSLALEYGIPVLLLIPRTRLLGLAIGLPFHFILGFDSNTGIVAFSGDVFALYSLFLPEDFAASILRLEWLPRRPGYRLILAIAGVALTLLLTVISTLPRQEAAHGNLLTVPPPPALPWYAYAVRLFWYAFALTAIFAFISVLARRKAAFFAPQAGAGPRRFQVVLQACFPLLVVLNGLGPYIGYKTVPCFSMFSNLRTEGGVTNHVFIGAYRPVPLESDLVEILDSSSPSLRQLKKDELRISNFELRRLGTRWSLLRNNVKADEINSADFWMEYRHHGQVVRVSRAQNPDAEAFQRPPWILNKLLAFRPVLPDDRHQRCVW